jgi:hypothetical protein
MKLGQLSENRGTFYFEIIYYLLTYHLLDLFTFVCRRIPIPFKHMSEAP